MPLSLSNRQSGAADRQPVLPQPSAAQGSHGGCVRPHQPPAAAQLPGGVAAGPHRVGDEERRGRVPAAAAQGGVRCVVIVRLCRIFPGRLTLPGGLHPRCVLRSAVLRRPRVRELRQQLHGAGGRSQPIPLCQLPVCAEHPEADAGEGDGPQCVPAGHVQEEVSGVVSSESAADRLLDGAGHLLTHKPTICRPKV